MRARTPAFIFGTAIVVLLGITAASLVIGMRVLAATNSPAPATTTTSISGPPNTVTVVGEGSALAVPDTATLTLGANTTRASVGTALSADNADMQRVISALHGVGVQDADIQTQAVNVIPQTSSCCPPVVTGYTASNQVTVTVHHLDNVGSVIAAVVGAVGNDAIIGNVSLSVADTTAAVNAARHAAIADAGVRAATWASLVHRSLGSVQSVSEVVSTAATQPSCTEGCGGAGGGAPIEAGQTKLTVQVTVTYTLS